MNNTGDLNPSAENEGCQCTDESNILASLVERSCQTSEVEDGVMLTVEGPCVPHSYGSGCHQHDFIYDPKCKMADSQDYCLRPWCYVDSKSCMQSSFDRVYRSTYFPRQEEGVELFYSYTTCDPSYDDWSRVQPQRTLGGVSIEAAIPRYMPPFMYKRNADGEILTSTGSEYYNSSIPYEGVLIHYLDSLMRIAEGELNISYTFGSQSSRRVHPTSSFTAVIQDIEDGLVDAGVGPFWVTGSRLEMTSFTIPLYYDRTMLVIKNPGTKTSLNDQIKKVLDPFTWGVWALILAIIVFTAFLSVWFSDRYELAKKKYGNRMSMRPGGRLQKRVYARLALDEVIQKGTFFFSAGVEQDAGANLSHKLLLLGFSFFVLIVVSAYVANLAAFLTRSTPDYVGTMESVVENGMKICAYSAMKLEYEAGWPRGNFVFSQTSDYTGVFEDFDAGKCAVMALPHTQLSPNIELEAGLCKRDLVFTQSLVLEDPVSFPIRPELGPGLSYWMHQGSKYFGVTLETSMEKFDTGHSMCKVDFSVEDREANEYSKISVENLFFPIIFFLSFAVLAIIVQIFRHRAWSKGRTDFAGRTSSLDLMREVKKEAAKEDSDATPPQPLPQPRIEAISIRKGTIVNMDCSNEVNDTFHENGNTYAVNEVNVSHSPSNDGDSATSRLHRLVETGALDEFFVCYNEIRGQKEN